MIENISGTTLLLTDSQVAPIYAHLISATHTIIIPAGEKNKTRETKSYIEDQMLKKKLGRDTTIIALGGGMITDLAGFVASTYCRGIPLILIPTTLLAMVDAALGGKNGVNTPFGKNMIGTIYEPESIIIDTRFLETLPKRQLSSGMIEVIKHGIIYDAPFFNALEKNLFSNLNETIKHASQIKKEIIDHDLREKGMRKILNFGHTIGHAYEKLSNYSLLHGEAVAIGILVESHLSTEICALPQEDLERIKSLIHQCCPNLSAPKYSFDEIWEVICLDKKVQRGVPMFSLISRIGEYVSGYVISAKTQAVSSAISETFASLHNL